MMISLDKIKINEKVKVLTVRDDSLIKRRLLDMGIIPGIDIEKVLAGPFKGISAYLVMGSVIALRDVDARCIEVEYD